MRRNMIFSVIENQSADWYGNPRRKTRAKPRSPHLRGGSQMRTSILAILMTLCLLLSGCHGAVQRQEFTVPEEFDTSRTYEISFWAKNDTNINQVNIYKQAIADFEALYPNIKVNLKLYTDYGRIYQDVITNIATDTTPNVCITYPDHIATYLTGNDCVVPLDELFADEKYGLGGSEVRFDSVPQAEIVPNFLSECAFDGQHYAMPFMRSTEVCYVNKTYVEALGFTLPETLTWDFIWQVSEKAMEQDAEGNYLVNGQKVLIPVIYKSTDNMMIQMLKQQDAGYSTADGQIQIFNDTTFELLNTVAQQAGKGTFSTFKIQSYPANFLNRGQCIFAIDSTAGATWMGSDAPLVDIPPEQMVEFETAVMKVPQFDEENQWMISQGPSVCVFNKADSQEVLASWLFAQFLLTDEVQIAYSQTEGYAPVTIKAQQSALYQDYLAREGEDNDLYYTVKLQAVKLLLENTDRTFVTPVFNGSASLRNAAGQMIEEVTKAVQRGKTVDEAFLQKLQTDMISLYRLDQIQTVGGSKQDLGPLPGGAVALLVSLLVIWVGIGFCALWERKRKDHKNQQ